jgi:hypothetical protein
MTRYDLSSSFPRKRESIFLVFAFLAIILWASWQWFNVRPPTIERDLFDWRQADTQSIALNFLHEDSRLLWPRINWRGAGPGFVESELQLYPYLSMQLMRVGGEGVWAGQLISLLAMSLAIFICVWQLAKRFSVAAVLAATVLLCSARNSLFLSTSVQPDALAFLAYVCGFWSFLHWLEDPRAPVRWLIVAVIFTTLTALIKPPALHLGIIQFLLVLLLQPARLRRPAVWVAWLSILLVVAAYLWHTAQLHFIYGNTFGVISGGDSKFPKLMHLWDISIWHSLAQRILSWGLGILGVLAVLFLTLRLQWDRLLIAMVIGVGIHLAVALRYTSGGYGSHYHVYALLLAAYALAKTIDVSFADLKVLLHKMHFSRLYLSSTVLIIVMLIAYGVQRMHIQNQERLSDVPFKPETITLSAAFNQYLQKNTTSAASAWPLTNALVVVRSAEPGYDKFWQTIHNFEDPRFFYTARVFGWILPSDPLAPEHLQQLKNQGAAYYAEPVGIQDEPTLDNWLQSQAKLVVEIPEGKVWALKF